MAAGKNDDLLSATQPAPSLSGPTHTAEPIDNLPLGRTLDRDIPAPPLPTQVRDQQRYHFLGEHGRGGLGRVSRVHDRELGRDVAIKELLSRGNANEVRFLREVLITARLEHPGIVPVHEAGRWADGTPFYAMKLVAGRPLRDLIAERAIEDRIGLLHHVIAVADAIAYAHGRNIIHRDLKPANVIIGDFGETIVIDWGLAKDLTSAETSIAGSGPFRTIPSDELTSTGSVVGTPAYMAPEQELGQPVDQRADVFAIGMMLWELCVAQKIPSDRLHLRHRILRRTGIDQDLATIIGKSLDPDPDRRYADAGALAADLKAFKSGARIAARSYSLVAMLAHWARRHRALAFSVATAIAIAIAGGALYIRNIAAERDRADSSEVVARRAQASAEASRATAEASRDELTLKNAELLLTTDPSAAIDVLDRYHGADRDRANQIRAQAMGLGVALLRAVPHTDNVSWSRGFPDGSVLSLSIDGTISRTSRDGTSVVLSRGAAKRAMSSYSPSQHLLAYPCDLSDLCLFDVLRSVRIPVASMLRDANARGIAFSPDGTLLAVLQKTVLNIVDVMDPARPALRFSKSIDGGIDVEFVSDDIVVVGRNAGVEFTRLNGGTERYSLPDISRWAAGPSEHALALATAKGQALILESFPLRVIAQADLCHGPTADLQFIPGRRSLAYACRDGAIGIWDLQHDTVRPRAQLEGHADLITTSPAGDYIIAAGGNGTVTVIDLETDLITSYKGHGFRLTSVAPPGPEQPFLVSGDARGGVRAWPLPQRWARVAMTASSPFYRAIFDNRSTTVTATTRLPTLTVFSPSTGAHALQPHLNENIFLEQSDSGRTFATYSLHDQVEVWSSITLTRMRVIPTGHGSLSQLLFMAGTDDFITSGHDGRLVFWTATGDSHTITKVDQPIDRFARASATKSVVFSTVDGALWRTAIDRPAVPLRPRGSRVNRIVALSDQQTVLVGYEDGDVIAINTSSWQQKIILHGSGSVREIAITGDDRTIAVATNGGTVQIGTHRDDAPSPAWNWVTLALHARHIALAPDGLLVAACTDGTVWLYSPSRQRWLCLPTGTADLSRAAATANGKVAVALDFEGRLIWIDLEAARKLL